MMMSPTVLSVFWLLAGTHLGLLNALKVSVPAGDITPRFLEVSSHGTSTSTSSTAGSPTAGAESATQTATAQAAADAAGEFNPSEQLKAKKFMSSPGAEVSIGDVSTGSRSQILTKKVCAQVDIPLWGKAITMGIAVSASFVDDEVTELVDTVVLSLTVMLELSFDLLFITLSLGVQGKLAVTANLPQAISGPMERTMYVLHVLVGQIMSKSKVMSHLMASMDGNDNAMYIEQVVAGVREASWPSEHGGCAYHYSPGGYTGGHCYWSGCDSSRNAVCGTWQGTTDRCICGSNSAYPCGPSPGHESYWDGQCKARVDQNPTATSSQVLADTFGEMWHNYVGSFNQSCGRDADVAGYCLLDPAWWDSDVDLNTNMAVFGDAQTYAVKMKEKNGKPLKDYYTNFMLAKFLYSMMGITFDADNGNWADHISLDCAADINPTLYLNSANRIYVNPSTSESAVRDAMARLCYFMSTGVLVPASKREDEDSTFYPAKHQNENLLNMLIVLVPDIYPESGKVDTWLTAGDFAEVSTTFHSMGGHGYQLSTFHHFMAIVSADADSVSAQLTKYLKENAAKNDPKQTCDAGIVQVDGSFKFQASAGSKGTPNMCNPGSGSGMGLTVAASYGFSYSSKKTENALKKCALGPFQDDGESLAVHTYITNIKPPLFKKYGEINIEFDGEFTQVNTSSPLEFEEFDLMLLFHKALTDEEEEAEKKPGSLKQALKQAIPEVLEGVFDDMKDTLLMTLNGIVDFFDSASGSYGKGPSLVSQILTSLLHIGYDAIGGFIGAVEDYMVEKAETAGSEALKGDMVKDFIKGMHGMTSDITSKIEASVGKPKIAMAVLETESLLGLKLVFKSCDAPCKLMFEIHMISGTLKMAAITEPVKGGAYNFDLTDDTLFSVAL